MTKILIPMGQILVHFNIGMFTDENRNYGNRIVAQPRMVSGYYKASNLIDIHNQLRQALLALEELWKTNDCWFRIIIMVIGMAVINAHLICRDSFASDSPYSSLTVAEFANYLAYQLAHAPFDKSVKSAKNVQAGRSNLPWFERILTTQSATQTTSGSTTTAKTSESSNNVVGVTVKEQRGLPSIPSSYRCLHKMVVVKHTERRGCSFCSQNGLKQKRTRTKCMQCNKFLCYDQDGRQCFYAHIGKDYLFKSGIAPESFADEFKEWDEERKEFDRRKEGK